MMTGIPSHATHAHSAFYGRSSVLPRILGSLAIETWHVGEASALIEASASRSRKDIDSVVVHDLRALVTTAWERIYDVPGVEWEKVLPLTENGEE